MVKIAFIDRDGVINKLIQRSDMQFTAPWSIEEFEFNPKVKEAVDVIKSLGYTTRIVTNQPDVTLGNMSWDSLNKINDRIMETLSIDNITMAHFRGAPDYKPGNNMLRVGLIEEGADKSNCWMIGDSDKDIIAGNSLGIRTIWISDKQWNLSKEYKEKFGDVIPNFQCSDLYEAALLIEGVDNDN
jgi:histidinol-phosphate phosphatase family protein